MKKKEVSDESVFRRKKIKRDTRQHELATRGAAAGSRVTSKQLFPCVNYPSPSYHHFRVDLVQKSQALLLLLMPRLLTLELYYAI